MINTRKKQPEFFELSKLRRRFVLIMLLLLFGPGLIGGILLPIINVLPDVIVVIVTGSKPCSYQGDHNAEECLEDIKHEVQIGIGSLIGSSLFILTRFIGLDG